MKDHHCELCGSRHAVEDACLSEAEPDRIGQRVAGKYEIVGLLGRGGMGTVYEARHVEIGRRFAIKFLRAKYLRSRHMLERFRREAQAAGALEHDHVVAVIDFGFGDDEVPFLVMEYLEGRSLGELLEAQGKLPMERAVELTLQACDGLAAAHERGIIHRDLKPDNLLVCRRSDETELCKVLDFGIAKLQSELQQRRLTRVGVPIGTPWYMSPEQARGDADLDERTDVYSLGVILYEALSGELPHPGGDSGTVLEHILAEPSRSLGDVALELPAELVAAIDRAVATRPADRFASVVELKRALLPFTGRKRPLRPQEARAATRIAAPLLVEPLAAGGGTMPLGSPAKQGAADLPTAQTLLSSPEPVAETDDAVDPADPLEDLDAAALRPPEVVSPRPREAHSPALLVGVGVGVVVVVAFALATRPAPSPPAAGSAPVSPVGSTPGAASSSPSAAVVPAARPAPSASQTQSVTPSTPGEPAARPPAPRRIRVDRDNPYR